VFGPPLARRAFRDREDETMLRRVILMLTLATITAVLLALGAGGAPAADSINCVAGKVCKGDSGDNLIIGSGGNDDINPFGGNDTVYANGGDDNVRHSYGNDIIWGGTGADTLRGGFGLDTIFGNRPATGDKGKPIDSVDNDHDLIDCAYLDSRGNTGDDLGFGAQEEDPIRDDTVVDCSNRDDQ
jgi:Ca2+-binding RTX toxin-like protein